MKNETIFLIIDTVFFISVLIFLLRKNKKLEIALDHFKPGDSEEDEIIDTIAFSQDYSKDLKLFKAINNNEDYYKNEVAQILAKELIKNKAVHIEFIQGIKKDTIKGEIKYIVKI